MRVLLAEDEVRLADLVARGLREQGYAVDVVHDGEDALTQLAVNEYDVAVLDVGLPRRDGFAVSAEVRQRGGRVPILMLTARAGVHDRVAGLDAGADDYLVKPFEFAELYARVRALLRRQPAVLPSVLAVGDLQVNTRTHVVTRGGREIALTPKEYTMLQYLVRHANRVVTRTELVEHVWDENHDPGSNAIDVYVGRLRRKVDVDGAPPLIHTRRGSGYIVSESRLPGGGAGDPTPG
jgi:two-component system copper resistance phosphate regulon response regulator CusR